MRRLRCCSQKLRKSSRSCILWKFITNYLQSDWFFLLFYRWKWGQLRNSLASLKTTHMFSELLYLKLQRLKFLRYPLQLLPQILIRFIQSLHFSTMQLNNFTKLLFLLLDFILQLRTKLANNLTTRFIFGIILISHIYEMFPCILLTLLAECGFTSMFFRFGRTISLLWVLLLVIFGLKLVSSFGHSSKLTL